jgi:hypothetical protein
MTLVTLKYYAINDFNAIDACGAIDAWDAYDICDTYDTCDAFDTWDAIDAWDDFDASDAFTASDTFDRGNGHRNRLKSRWSRFESHKSVFTTVNGKQRTESEITVIRKLLVVT